MTEGPVSGTAHHRCCQSDFSVHGFHSGVRFF
jgi:hypothetical protein